MLNIDAFNILKNITKNTDFVITDITGLLEPDMWSYGPDILEQMDNPPIQGTAPVFRVLASKVKQGWEANSIEMTTLTGTYLETGAHLLPDFPTIDQLPLESLFKPALVIQILKKAGEAIIADDIRKAIKSEKINPGDAVIINTGWSDNWLSEEFENKGPFFAKDAMEYLLNMKISLLASDIPRYDNPVRPANIVNDLFKAGSLLLAPVANLKNVGTRRCLLIVLPLKLKGLCASPCRALLVYGK